MKAHLSYAKPNEGSNALSVSFVGANVRGITSFIDQCTRGLLAEQDSASIQVPVALVNTPSDSLVQGATGCYGVPQALFIGRTVVLTGY